jgi:hypothetical protein
MIDLLRSQVAALGEWLQSKAAKDYKDRVLLPVSKFMSSARRQDIDQNTYFMANCSTLAGAVVGPSGVASLVAAPNVLPNVVPAVVPREAL